MTSDRDMPVVGLRIGPQASVQSGAAGMHSAVSFSSPVQQDEDMSLCESQVNCLNQIKIFFRLIDLARICSTESMDAADESKECQQRVAVCGESREYDTGNMD